MAEKAKYNVHIVFQGPYRNGEPRSNVNVTMQTTEPLAFIQEHASLECPVTGKELTPDYVSYDRVNDDYSFG